ncbi:hypothetical protein B1M_15038 [Burkholderia sp. TJI49]|nr:hypothetical protein B1M_15038 [Burkholderia sp. TJI49]
MQSRLQVDSDHAICIRLLELLLSGSRQFNIELSESEQSALLIHLQIFADGLFILFAFE